MFLDVFNYYFFNREKNNFTESTVQFSKTVVIMSVRSERNKLQKRQEGDN